jgi:hypothetical protein
MTMPRIPGPRSLAGSEHQCWFGLDSRRTAIIPAANLLRSFSRDESRFHRVGRSLSTRFLTIVRMIRGDGDSVSARPENAVFRVANGSRPQACLGSRRVSDRSRVHLPSGIFTRSAIGSAHEGGSWAVDGMI